MMSKTKKQYDRHKNVPLTVWVEEEYKEELKREAAAQGLNLHKWSLSAHVRFLLDDARHRWTKSYRPMLDPEKK
jgi:hypothetical protein